MLLAVVLGILRLMSSSFLGNGTLAMLYGLHSIIMVFEFLGGIIMTGRLVGVAWIPGAKKLRMHNIMVRMIFIGVIAEIVGYTLGPPTLRFLGASLLVTGCVIFLLTLRFLKRNSEV